ncbi:MAG: SDR family oxidoreductase [Porphyromonadaceae bacterium]|jgi:NAD(P)-dependent dehydrogenase (short-subunit alcohol dehydrogenase family)|nr:SDR family oxidoreductase [Porphyromonadaceae bacterium]
MAKRIFITGGAKGIGRAIVKAFSTGNNQVAFSDIDEVAGKELSDKTNALFFQTDAGNKEELEFTVKKLLADWGDIDVIINNVGVSIFNPITEFSVEKFEKVININLRSVFITSRLLAIHRKQQNTKNPYGRIINLCSTRYLMSESGTEAYSASKGGVYSLTHSLAVSLSPYNITVNSISPGWIENYNYEKLAEDDHAQHPSNRVGKPEDIARMCLFLCDEKNDFINGENIVIDGGMTKKMIYNP